MGKESSKITLSDKEWRERLSADQYRVLRQKGTEQAFIGSLNANKKDGTYYCAGCGQPLFSSDTKYESGSGWPSFWEPLSRDVVDEEDDHSLFMRRTEVLCSNCGGHLGHVFEDGPEPTGLRYCINSVALNFREKGEEEHEK